MSFRKEEREMSLQREKVHFYSVKNLEFNLFLRKEEELSAT